MMLGLVVEINGCCVIDAAVYMSWLNIYFIEYFFYFVLFFLLITDMCIVQSYVLLVVCVFGFVLLTVLTDL